MKIVSLGEIVVEIMATELNQPLSETGLFSGPFPSGAPAIFIDQVAKLGVDCSIISAVGKDGFGDINIKRLQKDGVDIAGISVLEDEVTGSAFVTYHSNGDRDFIFNIGKAACGQLSLHNANLAVLSDCTHLHIMGSSLINQGIVELCLAAIDIVKSNQGKVSFDPNIRKELLNENMKVSLTKILVNTDIYMPSEAEITVLSTFSNKTSAIEEYFNDFKVSEIVLKQGSKGAAVFTPNSVAEIPAFLVDEIDPTGAGDCFGGAYIACRVKGMGIEESLSIAAQCGARSVTFKGPMEGTSTREELMQFFQ
ncbi:Tagatose kinase [Vibrio crassostreae]|uniref:sugar kinase n=1 Tax=Vibrio crassostreae TaxID=246167 RepID=UPI00104DFE0C|nr:sugar kinase [Vibrio crassostreae]TCN90875.1 sugar/nucleoside kinase (ribokinase family) [Vibrio crassostreae]CAK2428111.1 Tagatose kinase [Vibrio crassostreae]CAK2490019.1 Tagatose kinase [Vibrio crassostreae]CAK3672163.1 Tagatose kinase [Vibrio crassostreae]CAK3822276.1 Tagatose kinase [Vibrio crassostreae]